MNNFELLPVVRMSDIRMFGDVPASAYSEQERNPSAVYTSTGYDGTRSVMGLGDLDDLDATIKSQVMMGMSSCGQHQSKTKLSAEYKLMWVFAFIIAAFVLMSWKHHTSSAHHGE